MQHEAMRQMGVEDHDQAPPIDNFAEGAERRVRLGLLVRQIIDDNNLVTDADKLRERVEEICSNYQNTDEMVATYMANPQVIAQIEPMVLEEQAVDWLAEHGVVKTEKVGFKEFMKP
jgi:trigger factor